MLVHFVRKHRGMILCSIFFFYFGCGITLSMLDMECGEAKVKTFIDESAYNIHKDVEYAVLILSSPDNAARRNAIRSTWMKLVANIAEENDLRIYRWKTPVNRKLFPPKYIKFYFVISTKWMNTDKNTELISEHAKNQDLLLLDDVVEGYRGLTEKLLKSFEWFSENLKNLKYLIKCDDDSFVRIDLIIRDLEAYGPSMTALELRDYVSYKKYIPSPKALYWGYFNGNARVYLSGKWQEEDWFLCDRYLPYALGGGYVVSRKIVDYIGINADWLTLYNAEDVSLGVWTAPLKDIYRVHDIRFDTAWKSRGCLNEMLIRHKQNEADMKEMYENLVNSKGRVLCTNETIVRKMYHYNWDSLPSQCCTPD